jgi:hypothetical protein
MRTIYIISFVTVSAFCADVALADNIDPNEDDSQYAYGKNVGWLNFEPNQGPGVTVTNSELIGYVWAENIGWINLDPNDADPNTGVSNDGTGRLSGYAWGENVGWINFNPQVAGDPNRYGVTIDSEGEFDGWAWGENIGWINFRSVDLYGQNVKVCVVSFEDLANFVDDWLVSGPGLPGDLSGNEYVDFADYSMFSDYWRDYCRGGWLLK